jgi:hypothetical protein
MGGGGSKLEIKPFNCDTNNRYTYRKTPYEFSNLKHVRCIFFTQENYNANYHIPKSTLTTQFYSTINNLQYDIDAKISEVANNVNRVVPGAKILNPIYVAFARTLEHTGSIFDDPAFDSNDEMMINIEMPDNNYKLAIKTYMEQYLAKMNSSALNKRYKTLPMNFYNFVNNKIKVIIYFPFMTSDYKYISNFKDIINSSLFFIKTILDTSFNGLPDVNTFNEAKVRKELSKSNFLSQETIDYAIAKMKEGDNKNFRYSDDLMYLCNDGGCLSESEGEDFNTLLPSLSANDSDNDNSAFKMSPFLPTKCLAQTIRYKCGILGLDNNQPLDEMMKSKEIIKYLTESLKKYVTNEECTLNKTERNKDYCREKADKKMKLQQTPVDILNYTFSYQLRTRYESDLNKKDNGVSHYSKEYSINIIKELMFLRNKYPGIQEIVFPLYIYSSQNSLTIDPPWGPMFLTNDQVFSAGENIMKRKYSFNNKYYLKMNEKGHITVNYAENDQIFYYLNTVEYPKPITMSFNANIIIVYISPKTGYQENIVVNNDITLITKDEKHREPFDFYINDEGRIRVFANGFIDATNQAFSNFVNNKIVEYQKYSAVASKNGIDYVSLYNQNNELDKNKINIEEAIYYDRPENREIYRSK